MDTVKFENTVEMVKTLLEKYKNKYWSVICNYEYASEVVEELVRAGKLIFDVSIHAPEIDGYDGEYIVSLCDDEIFCEKMMREGKYINSEDDITFVHQSCNSALLPYIHAGVIYEYSIAEYDDEDECDGDCENCLEDIPGVLNYSKGSDDKIHGFTYSDSDGDNYFSYSYYTKDELSIPDIKSILREMNI